MQGLLSSLELRVQFCLLVCCTYPSSSTVNKEKNLIDQRASLRADTRETQHYRQKNVKEEIKHLGNFDILKKGLPPEALPVLRSWNIDVNRTCMGIHILNQAVG